MAVTGDILKANLLRKRYSVLLVVRKMPVGKVNKVDTVWCWQECEGMDTQTAREQIVKDFLACLYWQYLLELGVNTLLVS